MRHALTPWIYWKSSKKKILTKRRFSRVEKSWERTMRGRYLVIVRYVLARHCTWTATTEVFNGHFTIPLGREEREYRCECGATELLAAPRLASVDYPHLFCCKLLHMKSVFVIGTHSGPTTVHSRPIFIEFGRHRVRRQTSSHRLNRASQLLPTVGTPLTWKAAHCESRNNRRDMSKPRRL